MGRRRESVTGMVGDFFSSIILKSYPYLYAGWRVIKPA
jgi:hypothetical protein